MSNEQSPKPRSYLVESATYENIIAERAAFREEVDRLRLALSVPSVWSQEERDGMSEAFKSAAGEHGHYETLFAVAAWLLRHRAALAKARGE
jgi:hypothetical protein